jgi:hypothetical protein
MCTLITSKGTDIDENIANQIMLPVHVHRNRGILTSIFIRNMEVGSAAEDQQG